MIKKFLTIAAIGLYSTSMAQTLNTPAPSTTQTIKQNFGLGSIELSYSRPNLKGRTAIGELVPFGKIWRTGANNATTLTFTDDVMIGGKNVAAGKYGLLTIPEKNSWTIIITKQLDVTSASAYKEESDVARVSVTPSVSKENIETFSMQFANVKGSSCDLVLSWENTVIALPINAEVDKKIMKQIDNIMTKDNLPYFNAAMYYMDNGKDLNQALVWFTKATENNPTAYWVHHQRANCLAKLGKKSEAITAASKSLELATAAKNPDYVKLNEDLLKSLK